MKVSAGDRRVTLQQDVRFNDKMDLTANMVAFIDKAMRRAISRATAEALEVAPNPKTIKPKP